MKFFHFYRSERNIPSLFFSTGSVSISLSKSFYSRKHFVKFQTNQQVKRSIESVFIMSSNTPESHVSSFPATTGDQTNSITQNCGQIDLSIKMNPSKLRRLEESSHQSSNITPCSRQDSLSSSASLYAPPLSTTTLHGNTSYSTSDPPRTLETGHGKCCCPDLSIKCLDCEKVEHEVVGAKQTKGIDRLSQGYTGPTNTVPETEEGRVAGRERTMQRLDRIK